jgi:hypothetical protein
MNTEFELFPGKNLSGLFSDIYTNQKTKKLRISGLIKDVKDLLKSATDYATLGPLLRDLVDSSIKNDDSLVKLATIAQRIISASIQSDGVDAGVLTDAEKEQILKEIDETVAESNVINDAKVDELADELDELKGKLTTNEQ